jgi:opine dehydrogenase
MRICICGGGGLGHTCAGVLSSHEDVEVLLYTKHSSQWQRDFKVNTPDATVINGHLASISDRPEDVIPQADMVFLCLPAFLVEKTLLEIRPYLTSRAIVGAVVGNSGFVLFCHKHLPSSTKLFAFQRVPYVSRVVEYGRSANLLGYHAKLLIATENIPDREAFCDEITRLFKTPTELADSFYEVTLSNSNPIIHTGRLYTMWHNWNGRPFDRNTLFYHEWTDEASELEIAMDSELFALLSVLNVNTRHLPTLLDHYEATDAASMTAKLRSIQSLSTILSPMVQTGGGGWIPDFSSRYFIEDFPYGLKMIHDLSIQHNLKCPKISEVLDWGMTKNKNLTYNLPLASHLNERSRAQRGQAALM